MERRFHRSRTRSQLATLTSSGTSSDGKFASKESLSVENVLLQLGFNTCISWFNIGYDALIAWGKEEGSALRVHGERRENAYERVHPTLWGGESYSSRSSRREQEGCQKCIIETKGAQDSRIDYASSSSSAPRLDALALP